MSPQSNLSLNLIENPTPKSFVKIELIESCPHTLSKKPANTSPNPVDPSWSDLLKLTLEKQNATSIGPAMNKKRKILICKLGANPNTIIIPDDNENLECSTLVGRRSTRLDLVVSKGLDSSKMSKSS